MTNQPNPVVTALGPRLKEGRLNGKRKIMKVKGARLNNVIYLKDLPPVA